MGEDEKGGGELLRRARVKEGHGRIREGGIGGGRLKERQLERDTVHALIRGAINNPGPDI